MGERQGGPYEWSPLFLGVPSSVFQPQPAKCTEWHEPRVKGLQTIDLRLADRAHIGGTWVYSRRTRKTVFSTEKKAAARRPNDDSNLDFLLTASHTTRLAAGVFRSPALGRVCSSGKRSWEIKSIAGRRGLRRRVVRRQIVPRR
jgi:hypothetical protein